MTTVPTPPDDAIALLRRESAIVAAVLALVGLVLGAGAWTWRIDQTLYDAGLRLAARTASPEIVIVAIDDESIAAIGRWPWPRAVHASLIERIAPAAPRAIGLDLLLTEPSADAAQDQVLGDAIRRAGNVVLPVAFLDGPEGVREMLPVPAIGAGAQLGHVDAELDADSILRVAWLHAGPGAPTRPHFALALLAAAHASPAALPATDAPRHADARAWQRDGRVLIRYGGPPGNVERIAYVHLLRGDVAPERLRGRYVLIGATAIGVGDAFATPVSGRERPMPGIEITANLLDNLAGSGPVHAVPPLWTGGLAALAAIALVSAMVRLRPRAALLSSLGLAFAAAPLALAGLAAGHWLAPMPFVLVALLAYPLWSWRRLEAATRYFDRELARQAGTQPDLAATLRGDGDRFAARLDAVRHAGERLDAARRLLAETLDALPEAVFVTRGDGRVAFANPRARALAGAQLPASVQGRTFDELLSGLVPQEVSTWPALFEHTQRARAIVVTEARSPALGDFLVRCALLRDAEALLGDRGGFVVAFADVTRLKTAERQRDDVLAFVSHDIRSPQASLLSLVELYRAGQLALEEGAVMGHIEDLARQSLALADEFVQVARAEAKPLALEDADPLALVRDAVKEIEPQATRKDVRVASTGVDPGRPLRIERALVLRALGNLLNNAVKFSPPGGEVRVSVAVDGNACEFAVEDRGPGIAEQDVGRLFQRYQRVESGSVLRVQPGIGLGLVFVDAVARRHGGSVGVRSRPGEGSRFFLRIPFEASLQTARL